MMGRPAKPRKPSALWHLMEEGTCTSKRLAALTGWTPYKTLRSLDLLINQCLASRVDNPRKNPATYGLTKEGIEAALQVNREDVEFAS